ncbi:MAG: type III pantothenate kinase [Spirochaetes bacterium]|nr:type III pantothenate kinase [Spirochaetota bacterium]
MDYILGFNIGNTNTMMGIYELNKITPKNTYTYKTDKNITPDELKILIKKYLNTSLKDGVIKGVAYSSVVTEVNNAYNSISKDMFDIDPLEINCNIKLDIKLMYDNPEELGPDRIANAEAAFRDYSKDCIIIDLGTANTFCVIHKNGTFDGGLIGPGIGITIDALAEKTSKLSRINFKKPDKFIATNTKDAITSGFFYGYLLMIKGIIAEIEKIYQKKFLILLTGGLSKIISDNLENPHKIDPLLTMKGIKYLYNINKKY